MAQGTGGKEVERESKGWWIKREGVMDIVFRTLFGERGGALRSAFLLEVRG